MNKRWWVIRSIVLVGFIIYGVLLVVPIQQLMLTVVMLNVGQGDAFYIRTPDGTDILIDGGPDRSVLFELGRVMPPFDHHIEYVVATHFDADHINGLVELPTMYTVGTLILNGEQRETAASNALRSWVQDNIRVVTAQQGNSIDADVEILVLNPRAQTVYSDGNAQSVVVLLRYGDVSFLFTGDAPVEVENDVLEWYREQYGRPLDVDVLKVGHHGSHTSTGVQLLEATTPSVALISAGAENRYGHPHPSVVSRLERYGITLWRTDRDGRVRCETDGVLVRCGPDHDVVRRQVVLIISQILDSLAW